MKKAIIKIIYIICCLILCYYIAIQAAFLLSFQDHLQDYPANIKFLPDPEIMWWQGNNDYFVFVTKIIGLLMICMIWTIFKPSKGNSKLKEAKRRMTAEEKREYSHLASVHEMKKGLTRLHINKNGEISNIDFDWRQYIITPVLIAAIIVSIIIAIVAVITAMVDHNEIDVNAVRDSLFVLVMSVFLLALDCRLHIRDLMDYVFDPLKRAWNELMFLLKQPDSLKMNTRKKYSIGGNVVYRRSGVPLLTYKNTIYVDAGYTHSIVIGTTNSGKTTSVFHSLIETTLMTGESMVVNDLKGELLRTHYKRLVEHGYNIINLNFVEPARGAFWNPFAMVYRKYREAEKAASDLNEEQTEIYNSYIVMKKDYLRLLGEWLRKNEELAQYDLSSEQGQLELEILTMMKDDIDNLKNRIDDVRFNKLPQPDFSDALEYLRDVSNAICREENAKDEYWWKQARLLLEGCVLFLLEYEYLDENGNIQKLTEDSISFKNIKLLKDEGMKVITAGEETLLIKFYLNNMRSPFDYSCQRMGHIFDLATETRSSVIGTFETKMDIGLLNERIARMLSTTSFDFHDIGTKKTAVFLTFHDEKATYYPLMTLFVAQLYEEVVKTSREEMSQMLPVPIHIIWDEFGISPAVKGIDNMLSAMRFRGVRMTMAVQDLSQLDTKYGKTMASTIKNNVMNMIYLLGSDPQGLEEISHRAGFKLTWNKERGCYEKVPTVSIDRLKNLSLGWAVVLRQRMNPAIIRYYPFSRYGYYKAIGEMDLPHPHELPFVTWFSLKKNFEKIEKGSGDLNIIQPEKQIITDYDNTRLDELDKLKKKAEESDNNRSATHGDEKEESSLVEKKESLYERWQKEL